MRITQSGMSFVFIGTVTNPFGKPAATVIPSLGEIFCTSKEIPPSVFCCELSHRFVEPTPP